MSIKIENLIHVYMEGTPFEKKAIDNINITIEDGEFVALIGHTGSGKSTLIQHINGLLKPKSGNIIIDNVNIADKGVKLSSIRKKVGLVFQYPEYQLFEETIEKDIAFGPTNLGLNQEEILNRVKRAMNIVGLDYEAYKDKSPFELSGGQKRRVAIAGVVAMEPKILILDEPTAGLDPKARDDIY
ncbi:ABC transporter, partial [Clostridium butyricum]